MMRFKLLFLILLFSTLLKAQNKVDLGLLGGGSYYNGQMNPVKQFNIPSFSKGGFVRFNFDQRHALRFSAYHSKLLANAENLREQNYPITGVQSLNSTVVDVSAQFEFNFLPYISGVDKHMNSLYLAAGLGYGLIINNSEVIQTPTIPFGLGYKVNITNRLSTGLEWSFRKTFKDNLDGVESPLGTNLINNNDWYSFFGLFISYKFFKFAADCAVYN